MTIASSAHFRQKPLGVDDFLTLHGDDNRYELIDGEIFDWNRLAFKSK